MMKEDKELLIRIKTYTYKTSKKNSYRLISAKRISYHEIE